MRVGLFGGTFDPIHYGHLRCAEEAREALQLEKVLFVPSAIPPHKSRGSRPSAPHRLSMVRLAIRGNPWFAASNYECKKNSPSYSIETVAHFLRIYKDSTEIAFIMGSDAFREITTWKDYMRLFSLCSMIVLTRPGSRLTGIEDFFPVEMRTQFRYDTESDTYTHLSGHSIYFRGMTFLDISATDIRRRVREGGSISYLVPPQVEKYIRTHRLYQDR